MIETNAFKEVLEEEIGKGWRTETDTRTLKTFNGGGENRFTVEIEFDEGEYLFFMQDSVMSADDSIRHIDQDVALDEFREFVSQFNDSVTPN